MDTIIASIVTISLFLFAGLTIFETSLKTQETLAQSWIEMETRSSRQANSAILPIDIEVTGGGNVVEVTLKNTGGTRLDQFDEWDVMFQYYDSSNDYHISWYPFTSGGNPNNHWQVEGIYFEADSSTDEVFEPGVLNPSEEMILELRVSPKIKSNTIGMLLIATNDGITTSAQVER